MDCSAGQPSFRSGRAVHSWGPIKGFHIDLSLQTCLPEPRINIFLPAGCGAQRRLLFKRLRIRFD